MNAKDNHQTDFIDILREKVIPQVLSSGISRVLLAPPQWSPEMKLPEGMTAEHIKLRGKRTKGCGSKPYGKMALTDAFWIADRLHSARMPLLCFVAQGPIACQIADYVVHCDTGHAYLIPPGIPYSDGSHRFLDETKLHQGKCTRLQMLPYDKGLYCWRTHNWIDAKGRRELNQLSHSLPLSRVPEYLYELMDEMMRHSAKGEIISDGLLRILLGTLCRELQKAPFVEVGKMPLSINPEQPKHTITRIERYIHQNLAENLTIETLSRRAAMSRTAFTVQFRARTGKSLVEYLTDLRLEKARELLRNGDLAVRHVASDVGVRQSRLRALFQQREGVSPSEYRRQQRENQDLK